MTREQTTTHSHCNFFPSPPIFRFGGLARRQVKIQRGGKPPFMPFQPSPPLLLPRGKNFGRAKKKGEGNGGGNGSSFPSPKERRRVRRSGRPTDRPTGVGPRPASDATRRDGRTDARRTQKEEEERRPRPAAATETLFSRTMASSLTCCLFPALVKPLFSFVVMRVLGDLTNALNSTYGKIGRIICTTCMHI